MTSVAIRVGALGARDDDKGYELMEFIAQIADNLSGALLVLAGVLFALRVVVLLHEMGRFMVARWCGVTVSSFSIGFG